MAGGAVPPNLAPIFQAAGKAYGVPPSVLAGIASVESNFGANQGPSSTGAVGVMQFEPGTARSIGINPLDPKQAIFGAAKLLTQYGYAKNPTRAIGAYNGGPGNPQYGYARQVLSEAQRVGGAGTGPTLGLTNPTSSNFSIPVFSQSFNQAGFKQAQNRYIAGTALKAADSPSNPFSQVPGASKGFADSLGSGSGALFSKGLLSTQAPNPQSFVKSSNHLQHLVLAQTSMQEATGAQLATHPAVAHAADKVLAMARAAIGGPYSQAQHSAAFTENAQTVKARGTDCSGFVSWLMGPDGLGVWKQALATPDIPHAPGIQQGPGQAITIWNNPLPGNSGHVFISIDGRFFQSAGGGTGIQPIAPAVAQQMIRGGDNGGRYYALHPKGY